MANHWDIYSARLGGKGVTKRDLVLTRAQRHFAAKLPNSLSYHDVLCDGVPRNMAIINTQNLDIKQLCSMPGEDITHGSMINWEDNNWLVVERDANNEVYTRAMMRQCNYLLRWIDNGEIIERWCIIEDGTKYMAGEQYNNEYVMTTGDSRIAVIISKDEYTARLNRTSRFIIDDFDSAEPLAYRLTKPLKMGGVYNGEGVFKFVLSECNREDDDNFDLHIADYYKVFPRENTPTVEEPPAEDGTEPPAEEKRKVWI